MDQLPNPVYETLIFTIRGVKVMIDTDLATLYEVPTKRLKEQVKRNQSRFPSDFMFGLSKKEKNELVANCDRLSSLKHSSILPMAFTEQGIAMLSSVLRSERAIRINIEIMRAFARYRSLLRENEEMKEKIHQLDQKIDRAFSFLLEKIDSLQESDETPRNPIGFKTSKSS